ncbi:hypothetical protein TA3x_002997 [Tundrisphaera sp. TA3]|uniref:hypothetical protein n=1 Tax=Tundrisphaera sp. TA3 TaxID=3435775 RepID=UPI003EBB942D
MQTNRKRVIFPLRLLALIALCGCGGTGDGLARQAVSGNVTLDGKPLAAGGITFDPVDPGKPGSVSGFAPVSDGSYAIDRSAGLTPGSYRVSIVASSGDAPAPSNEPPGGSKKKGATKAAIPPKYNTNSTLKAEIKPGASDPIDFTLTSR